MKRSLKRIIKAAGLASKVSSVRYAGRLAINPRFRRLQRRVWSEYFSWRRHAAALRPPLLPAGAQPRRALIVAKGTAHGAQIELGMIKALELASFRSTVLTDRSLDKFYGLAGVTDFIRWEDQQPDPPLDRARAIVSRAGSLDGMLDVEHAGTRVGKFAASTTFRSLRLGRLDFSSDRTRDVLSAHLAEGMARAEAAGRIIDRIKPDLAVFMGNRYTGQSELMDACLAAGVDVLTWFDAHRSSSLMLKRYRLDNRDRHHGSLSDETWSMLRAMTWSAGHDLALRREVDDNYAAGDWYSRGGTQVNKSIFSAAAMRERLSLDPARKTAVIFPHIVWDATLFWGADLFSNYEDWLVETVRAAAANPRVNWIVKIHPAHVAKGAMDRYHGEAAEVTAIRERVGTLPDHVKVIPPDTDINTFSLFPVMDYCLTVRGTIGIEAASAGVRVLTAGSGRYDHRGFTVDSGSRDEYLRRLGSIESLAPPSDAEVELARKFAYGQFVLRPWMVSSFSIKFGEDIEAKTRIVFNARTSDELRGADDLNAFAAWAADGRQEDFLWRPALEAVQRSA